MKQFYIACVLALFSTFTSVYAEFEASTAPLKTPDPRSARNWDLSIRSTYGLNDNVQIAPESTFYVGDNTGRFFSLGAYGTYRFINSREWLVYFSGSLDQLWNNGHEDGSEYDQITVHPSINAAYRYSLAGIPSVARASFDHRYEYGEVDAIGLNANTIRIGHDMMLAPDLVFSLDYSRGWEEFRVDFPMPNLDDRDATTMRYRAGISYRWNQGRQMISAGYSYLDNKAKGSNYEFDADIFDAEFKTHIEGPVWARLGMSRQDSDYNGFVSGFIPAPGRTEQDTSNYSLQLMYLLDKSWTLDAFYTYQDLESNQAEFESDVTKYGIGVTYRF